MKKQIIRLLNAIIRVLNTSTVNINVGVVDKQSDLTGTYAVVTGGAKGIGKAISKRIVDGGGKVLMIGRDEKSLIELKTSLGNNANYLVFDITNFNKYDEFLKRIFEIMPLMNTLILNAGISLHEKSFIDVTLDGFDKQISTNLKAYYFLTQKFIKSVKLGNIIFISSETADMKCLLPYGLTKAAINSFVGALSCKYYKKGFRINAVAPGVTVTNMVKNNNDKADNFYCNNMGGRYFLPEEVAETVAFLLSDLSNCISGEVIHTNAGNHHRPQ